MIRWPRAGSLVLVRWLDAHELVAVRGRQMPAGELSDDPLHVETVGWLRRTRRYVHLHPERLPLECSDRYRGATRIPIGWVVDVVRIAGP